MWTIERIEMSARLASPTMRAAAASIVRVEDGLGKHGAGPLRDVGDRDCPPSNMYLLLRPNLDKAPLPVEKRPDHCPPMTNLPQIGTWRFLDRTGGSRPAGSSPPGVRAAQEIVR
jgi:hypothetical protein